MTLEQIIDSLIGREGGYVNHPADKGGPTIWGITEPVARAFGYQARMQDMPRSVAVAIYTQRYWEQPRFNLVATHSQPIAIELLDTGVNMGPATVAKFLQRALNVLNQQAQLFPDLVPDGAIGNITIAALRAYLGKRGKEGETVLLRMLNSLQGARYIDIAEKTPSQEAFVHGWFLHRVEV